MNEVKFIFGIFHKGQLILPYGSPTTCTYAQAEFISIILGNALKDVIHPEAYFGYDFASNHNMN